MSHNLPELLLALVARVWRGEQQSVRAVVGPAGKGVVERELNAARQEETPHCGENFNGLPAGQQEGPPAGS